MPGLSHGAFRLYVILAGAAAQRSAEGDYFPVTLKGLLRLHPGIAGRCAGTTTVLKQMAELQRRGLILMDSALHRNEPELPVRVKVLEAGFSEEFQIALADMVCLQ
jgi:hypothetical protein